MLYTERIRLVCSDLCEPDKARRQAILRPLFDSYEVTADYPSCILMDDLLEMYPQAKLVFNVREEGAEVWQRSIQSTLSWFSSTAFHIATC